MNTYKRKYQKGGNKSNYSAAIQSSRKGTQLNFLDKPVSQSSHKMTYSKSNGKYYVYPTLFQDDRGNWYERSGADAQKEAKKKGEVYEFDTEEEAINWSGRNAPWKDSNLNGESRMYQAGGEKDKDDVAGNRTLPEVEVEAKDTRSWVKKNYQKYISPIGHGILDVAGMVPLFGEAADGINAVWYTAEGNYVDAALSSAAMIPFAGWAATGTKWTKNTIKAMDKVTPGGGGMYQQLRYLQEVNPKLAAELGIRNKKQIKKMLTNDPSAAQRIIDNANTGKVFDGKVASTTTEAATKTTKAATKEVKRGNDYNITNNNTVIDPTQTYRKSAIGMDSRTHPMRGGHTFSDIAEEYTWLNDASKLSDNVAAPFNPRFNESGNMISFDLTKYDDYVPFTSHKMQFPDIPHTKFKTDLSGTMADLQNKGFHHMDMHGGNVLVRPDKVGNILDYKIIDPVGYTHDFQKSKMFLQNNPAYQNFNNFFKDGRSDDLFRIKNEFRRGGVKNKKGGLYANMNAQKEAGTSRSKNNSTVSSKNYSNMKKGFPKKTGGVRTKRNDFTYDYINNTLKRFK